MDEELEPHVWSETKGTWRSQSSASLLRTVRVQGENKPYGPLGISLLQLPTKIPLRTATKAEAIATKTGNLWTESGRNVPQCLS